MTLRLSRKPRLVLILAAALTLAACGKAPESATAPSAAAQVAATTPAQAPATAPDASVGTAPLVLGTDYFEIPGGQPFAPVAGKIEVVEVFSYTCPHCAEFEPLVNAWHAAQAADVNVVPLAAPYGGNPMPFARAFYAAETMGLLGKTHEAMFRAIHVDHSLPLAVSDAQIAQFYAGYGADPQQFASTMVSFAVDAKVKRAMAFAQQSGVDGTPALVVDGRYRVLGTSFEDMLRIASQLVAQQRAAKS